MRWGQHRAWEWKVPVMLEGCVSVRLAGGGGNRLWGWGDVEGGASGTQAFINAKGSRKEPHNSYFLLHLASLEVAIFPGVRRPGFWGQFYQRLTARDRENDSVPQNLVFPRIDIAVCGRSLALRVTCGFANIPAVVLLTL